MPGGSQRYWDTVAVQYFPERYDLHVRPCAAEDVVELDTFDELCAYDPSHRVTCGIAEGGGAEK